MGIDYNYARKINLIIWTFLIGLFFIALAILDHAYLNGQISALVLSKTINLF